MQQQQFQISNEILLQIIVWLGSVSIGLLFTIGGIILYVFRKSTKDNDSEHCRIETDNNSEHIRIEKTITDKCSEISSNLCIFRKEIRDDIKGVHARIDSHLEVE
jgi:hypothetical protein